jgi:tetratricopeptide (TPR) repeat protein
MGQVVARGAVPILDGGVEAMNRETDLDLARAAIPANLKLLEGLVMEDPRNADLRIFTAQGFYAYAFSFIEPEDPQRAARLYRRCYEHGLAALQQAGFELDPSATSAGELEKAVGRLGESAVPALFWTASCQAKWIDMRRHDPNSIAEMASAATLMSRVLALDERYYYGGPHLFFGVYYGSRAPMLGGNYALAEEHFRKANEINDGKLLIVDVLYAQYLARQRMDRTAFNQRLTHVIDAPENLFPEMAFVNTLSRQRAQELLDHEAEWF